MVSFSLHLIPLLTLPRLYGKVKTMGVDCTEKLYTFVRPWLLQINGTILANKHAFFLTTENLPVLPPLCENRSW